ncbi:unnamed protein product [Penicillium manginii]
MMANLPNTTVAKRSQEKRGIEAYQSYWQKHPFSDCSTGSPRGYLPGFERYELNNGPSLIRLDSPHLLGSVNLLGERIHTIEQMLDALEKSDASEKYDIALFCYGKLISAHDLLGDGICRLFDYVSSAELWKGHHDTQE